MNDLGCGVDGMGLLFDLVNEVVVEIVVMGGEVFVNMVDVGIGVGARLLVEDVLVHFGCFDVLVNNVGML